MKIGGGGIEKRNNMAAYAHKTGIFRLAVENANISADNKISVSKWHKRNIKQHRKKDGKTEKWRGGIGMASVDSAENGSEAISVLSA